LLLDETGVIMRILQNLKEPLRYIQEQPFQFITWVMVAIILGLVSFWAPILILLLLGRDVSFYEQIRTGVLLSFNFVILADGIATSLVSENSGKNTTAAGIRGIAGAFAIFLVVLNVLFFAVCILNPIDPINQLFSVAQIVITIISIFIACYLRCFQSSDWEKSVEDHKKREDQDIENLIEGSQVRSQDDKGIKL
jgi:hypothetical protein